MDGGLLSLKWNNHRSSFLHVLSTVRKKNKYADATVACDGNFYKVHKLVLSTCSEYFEQMFEQTDCKHPVIVLKDIRYFDFESLLSYMYIGEVNVEQENLPNLIKAAECLKIKGLAVPDEEPTPPKSSREKRSADNGIGSESKRRKEDNRQNYANRSIDDRLTPSDLDRRRSKDNKFRNDKVDNYHSNVQSQLNNKNDYSEENQASTPVKNESRAAEAPPEINLEEPEELVKQEPTDNDMDAVYIDDSNPASEMKDLLVDNFGDDGDGQQHFMNELLDQNSAQGNMSALGNYADDGSAGGSDQQMVQRLPHSMLQPRTAPRQPHTAPRAYQTPDPCGFAPLRGEAPSASANDNLKQMQQLSESISSSGNMNMKQFLFGGEDRMPGLALPPNSSSSFLFQPDKKPFTARTTASLELDERCSVNAVNLKQFMIGSGQYCCPFCQKVVKTGVNNFRSHYVTHTGERPFACPYCSYRTTQKSHLKGHVGMKHAAELGAGHHLQ